LGSATLPADVVGARRSGSRHCGGRYPARRAFATGRARPGRLARRLRELPARAAWGTPAPARSEERKPADPSRHRRLAGNRSGAMNEEHGSSFFPAPGKLNLMLRVLGRRADGYHLLQTVIRFIDYGDTLG